MWWSRQICCVLFILIGKSHGVEWSEYLPDVSAITENGFSFETLVGKMPAPMQAKGGMKEVPWVNESKYLTYLHKHTYDEFISHSLTPYVLVLFHSASCRVCAKVLTGIEAAARDWEANGTPIVVGHIDGTDYSTYWKKKFGFSVFPQLFLWHRDEPDFAVKQMELMEFASTITKGSGRRLIVTEDQELMLDAARAANMAQAKDHARLEGLGQTVWTDRIMLNDFTARVQLPGQRKSMTWFPLETLSFPDGRPLMAFKRPSKPMKYRDVHWERDNLEEFVMRMMRPTIREIHNMTQLNDELKDDHMVALVLCGDSVPHEDRNSPMGFEGLAKSWQDRHQAFIAREPDACPVAGEARPLLVVYSPAHQQWSIKGPPVAAAVSVGLLELMRSADNVYDWFNIHRFPGMFKITHYNFKQLIPAVRNFALIAIDPKKEVQSRLVEDRIREVTRPVPPMSKEYPEVYTYEKDVPYFGVVDGYFEGLYGFGIHGSELPRVVVFELHSTWVEDIDALTVWNLKEDLKALPQMYRYGARGWKSFLLTNAYRPYKDLDRVANEKGGILLRIVLLVFMVIFLALAAYWFFLACKFVANMLKLEENSALRFTTIRDLEDKKEQAKADRRIAKGLPPRKPKIHLPKQDNKED